MTWLEILIPHLKTFEGLRLEAYRDAAGVWTIGYGSTQGVRPGMAITEAEAERRLCEDVDRHAEPLDSLVQVPLSQHERAALASFVFNVGAAFAESTLLRKLNAGDRQGAADEFLRWVYAGGQRLAGLERRREAERAMFLAPDRRTGVSGEVETPDPVLTPALEAAIRRVVREEMSNA